MVHALQPNKLTMPLWRLRYRLTLRDLSEMFLQRGIVFSHEAVRGWEAKLAPILAHEPRQRRHGGAVSAAVIGRLMKPTSRFEAGGATCIAPLTAIVISSTPC